MSSTETSYLLRSQLTSIEMRACFFCLAIDYLICLPEKGM